MPSQKILTDIDVTGKAFISNIPNNTGTLLTVSSIDGKTISTRTNAEIIADLILESRTNKVTTLTNNTTDYPSTSAVTSGIAAALSGITGSYIQNQTSTNQTANFRISGNGLIAGNLGIGTTLPGFKLHILDSAAISANGQTIMKLTSTYSSTTIGSGGRLLFAATGSPDVDTAGIRGYTFGAAQTGLAFETGYGALTTKMVIDNSGNVGIGITVPTSKLHVIGNALVNGSYTQVGSGANTFTGSTQFTAAGATSGAPVIFASGSNVINALFGSGSATGFTVDQYGGAFRFNGASVLWGDMSFYPNGGGTTGQGNFRLSTTGSIISTTPSGKLGIGSLYVVGNTGLGTTNPSQKLDVVGNQFLGGTLMFTTNTVSTSGISFWDLTYSNWNIFMSTVGTLKGPKSNLTLSAGTLVTNYALRSVIEAVSGYGWTWESSASGGGASTIKAELSSNTGNFRVIGKFNSATLTPNRVVVSDADKYLVSSNVTTTELDFLTGVTSPIQGQIDDIELTAFQTFYVDENMDLIANSASTPLGYTFSLTADRDLIVDIS